MDPILIPSISGISRRLQCVRSGLPNKDNAASFSSELVVTKQRDHMVDERAAERFNVKAVSSTPLGFHLLKSTRPYRFN